MSEICLRTIIDPPTLRQHNGDVIIKLSEDPEDHLLLERRSLAKLVPALAPLVGISPAANHLHGPPVASGWGSVYESVVDPVTGASTDIYGLSLHLESLSQPYDSAWILSGDTHAAVPLEGFKRRSWTLRCTPSFFCSSQGGDLIPLRKTKMGTYEYSEYYFFCGVSRSDCGAYYQYDNMAEQGAILEYKTLFAMIYKQAGTIIPDQMSTIIQDTSIEPLGHLGTEHEHQHQHRCITLCIGWHLPCCDSTDSSTNNVPTRTRIVIEHLANVAARAPLHLCLLPIARNIIHELASLPGIWNHVAQQPHFWIAYAQVLR